MPEGTASQLLVWVLVEGVTSSVNRRACGQVGSMTALSAGRGHWVLARLIEVPGGTI
jgi:hypothetical protein